MDLESSRSALKTLYHRGPDQWGEWYDEDVYVGHRRLSIIDLSDKGRQPMCDRDQQVIIAVNGEIYNFKELRNELKPHCLFESESDSEVILHGYQYWGIDRLLEKLEGMYAFSIYDINAKTIYLARDRVGIKPLYYGIYEGQLVWASELKAIVDLVGKNRLDLDLTAIYDFLTYRYIPKPKTLYKDTYKLEPAHLLQYDLKSQQVSLRKYWELPVEQRDIPANDAAEQLRSLIRNAVEEQMVSDVPVGFFLSGGIDSSTVVAEAASITTRPRAYSIGFDVADHDETSFAEIVAKSFDIQFTREILSEKAAMELSNKLIEWYDEPFADTSALPTYLVAELARRDVKVVLTGDGGDEVFGGYNWYNRFLSISSSRFRNATLGSVLDWLADKAVSRGYRRAIRRIRLQVSDDLELHVRLLGGLLRHEKRQLARACNIEDDYDDYWAYRKYYRPDLPIRTRLQYLDFHTYLPDDILTKVDRATMAVALEARVPLLSTPLIQYGFSLPESIRYADSGLKGIMKLAYREILPAAILTRPKKGFGIPYNQWLQLSEDNRFLTKQELILSRWEKEMPPGIWPVQYQSI